MTDPNGQPISLHANVLEGTSDGVQITYQTSDGQTVTTLASNADAADIVSKAFTTVADGTDPNVEYITMTPEEAAAAGVVAAAPEEEQQVVTTSLQFDPANPSVLYTADGTPINQADLTPEEQALVQAALQQHLAEQEAEQQLALMQESSAGETPAQQAEPAQVTSASVEGSVTSTSEAQQEAAATVASAAEPAPAATTASAAAPIADDTVTSTGVQQFSLMAEGIDLASPNTSASQIVQSLAENVRKQQLQEKLQQSVTQSDTVKVEPTAASLSPSGVKYTEKIVIRQGQPQVVKVPVKKKAEIPAALASLMPKVEIGKDGSQVIRIHQSQITSGQLKALQDNPNVRLVFRPASSSRGAKVGGTPVNKPKKRGRPRKNPLADTPTAKITGDHNGAEVEAEPEEPPAKTRCGRVSKRPIYTKDYLTPKMSSAMDDDNDQIIDPGDANFIPNSASPTSPKKGRGRPPGSSQKPYKRTNSYASKIEALRNQDNEDGALTISTKPALTPIEQAISTRRKNRLKEMLSACSEDEIMEVALPHIARVFSLWEFLVTKVEKNKMTRVFFADVYKEYECLHKYVSKLAEKYNKAIESQKISPETTEPKEGEEGKTEEKKDDAAASAEKTEDAKEPNKDEPKTIKVTCAKLAESLGIKETTLVDAEIPLLDPEEAIGPRIMGMSYGAPVRRTGQGYSKAYENAAKAKVHMVPSNETKSASRPETTTDVSAAKPVQTEATSTISRATASGAKGVAMPPLKPLGQVTKPAAQVSSADAGATSVNGADVTPMDTQAGVTVEGQGEVGTVNTEGGAAVEGASAESAGEGTGTQLIQIGQGDEQQFIEVPEGYTLIQTPEGLVMSQPGTTISQGEDGTIYVTHADGTTTPLNAAQQEGVPMETVESLLSLDGQQQQTQQS